MIERKQSWYLCCHNFILNSASKNQSELYLGPIRSLTYKYIINDIKLKKITVK